MKTYIYQMLHNHLFMGFEQEEIEHVLTCTNSHMKSFSKDEIIDDIHEFLSVIVLLEGEIKIFSQDPDGNKSVHMYLDAKDGLPLYSSSFRDCHIEAHTACTLLLIPYQSMIKKCTTSCTYKPRLHFNLLDTTSQVNHLLMEKLNILAHKKTKERILYYLQLQFEKHHSNVILLPLNRNEFAEYLNVDRSALSRELSQLKKEGIIDFDKNIFKKCR